MKPDNSSGWPRRLWILALVILFGILFALRPRHGVEAVPAKPSEDSSVASTGAGDYGARGQGTRRRQAGGLEKRTAEEAVRALGARFGVPVRVAGLPAGLVSVEVGDEPPRKALDKLAVGLGVPLIAAEKEGELVELNQLTLTAGGLVVGATSDRLELALNRLARESEDERLAAVEELDELADERLEGVFTDRLAKDADPQVRGAGAAALRSARRESSHKALAEALRDPDGWVADNARVAIQENGAGKMEGHLRTLLAASDVNVRMEAADVLERVFGLELAEDFWVNAVNEQNP